MTCSTQPLNIKQETQRHSFEITSVDEECRNHDNFEFTL